MSSNFMSRPIEVRKHKVIYSGLQKNAGPAGMVVNFVHEDYCSGKYELPICPIYCSWKTCAGADSMYNTPACFSIYAMGEYLNYTKSKGGVQYWQEQSEKKSGAIYDVIDGSDGFYRNPVDKACRSHMNIPFIIKGGDADLEKKFMDTAKAAGLCTLAGHKSVGGLRASVYNGMPLEGAEALATFMKSFAEENRA